MTLPKYGGRDCELSTTGCDGRGRPLAPWEVTCRILDALPAAIAPAGVRTWSRHPTHAGGFSHESARSADCRRHWTSGGQCYYSDMSHVEVCTASTLYPTTFAAQCISTLLVAEAARARAQSRANGGEALALTAANADVMDPSISFGTHLSLTVEPSLWEDLFVEPRHPAILGYVASAVAAAIAFFGAGHLLCFPDGFTIYSLSARAHHLSRITTLSTTQAFQRGILNSRREPFGRLHDRLHLIGFDYCLLSSALLFSFLQCALAAAEEGYCGMILFDPVRSLQTWSWNIDPRTGRLPATATLIDRRELTLPAYMRELTAMLLRMCEANLITPQVAPQALEMLPRILELTHYVEERSLVRAARHLTWAAKLLWLTQLCADGACLGDAQTRLADHDFTHTDPHRGPFWRLWRDGIVDPLVTLRDARRCVQEGPAESRDWGRGQLIKRFFHRVTDVDWDSIELHPQNARRSSRTRIDLPHPASLNQAQAAAVFMSARSPAAVRDALQRLSGDTASAAASAADPVWDFSTAVAPSSSGEGPDATTAEPTEEH